MKDYLKLHTNQVLYDAWKVSGSYIVPNVSIIKDIDSIIYNPATDYIVITPARYLTFRAESNNSSFGLNTIAAGHKVYYSRDLRYWKLFDTEEDVAINNGEEAYVIGDADAVSSFSNNNKTTFRMGGGN